VFEKSFPQIVMHILQKAFFKHALVLRLTQTKRGIFHKNNRQVLHAFDLEL